MAGRSDPLAPFHPEIRRWFRARVGEPTDVQRRAWPVIARGRHVLVVAPTGSGKTLTAFLWALDRLLTGAWPGGTVRVLYVSPLKALNTDIRRNLLVPLGELSQRFRAADLPLPEVRVLTRSGDTPPPERQRMVRRPPEILITTPESLNILLTSQGGRSMLTGVATVILDEIHAVAGSKRGTHLATAVERLVALSGEFQRLALSATVRPAPTIAAFVGGFEVGGAGGEGRSRPRPVEVVRSSAAKRYDLKVRLPAGVGADAVGESFWEALTPDFIRTVRANRSTLLFTNSRRLAERVTRMINDQAGTDLAYSHHGSLSKEVRAVVEERLKAGELAAIVATASLELGIDVGDIDEVVLIQSPHSAAAAVQRIGRSGHRVGEVSRGALYPTFGRDFLEAAVVARAVLEGDIEAVAPVEAPLDVLAQVILSMTAAEPWNVDALFAAVRAAYPYRRLTRRQFDLVIEMLAGRYADARVRELRPRLAFDRVTGTVRARPGAARLLYLSGGTIPDRGYFHLRLADSMARLGELDEEFVWERSVGDVFTLGAQAWRIRQITHNDVLVSPAGRTGGLAPFWRADERDRDFHLSERVGRLLAEADLHLGEPAFAAALEDDFAMEPAAAGELIRFLSLQKAATGGALPHRQRLLVERVAPAAGADRRQVILHTFWGGRVNRPLAVALAAAWAEKRPGEPAELTHDDDCILLSLPYDAEPGDLLALVDPGRVEALLRQRLETTGFFGARFRHNAGRALLLPAASFKQRTPLWLNRERAKRLLAAVSEYEDFPVLVETWRTCLRDEFDLATLKRLLAEVEAGEIAVTEVTTERPSPFAEGLMWRQTNRLMYEDDTPTRGRPTSLSGELLRELVLSSSLRPKIAAALIEEFRTKVQRLHPGYAPQGSGELLEWVKERLLVPAEEWRELLAAVERDGGEAAAEIVAPIADRLLGLRLPGASGAAVAAVEALPRLARALGLARADLELLPLPDAGAEVPSREALAALARLFEEGGATSPEPAAAEGEEGDADPAADLLAEWGRFYGPFATDLPRRLFGFGEERFTDLLETLTEGQRWVVDRLRRGAEEPEICDTENLETLLRWSRAAARPAFEPLPLDRLPLFLAAHQGLTAPGGSIDDLKVRLEQLLGWPAPAGAWEAELLPARLQPYHGAWLDSLLAGSELFWLGVGRGRLTFAFPGDLELLVEAEGEGGGEEAAASAASEVDRLFPDRRGRYDLAELMRHSGLDSARLTRRLWELAWEGRVSNDSFLAVRRGVLARFAPPELPAPGRGAARRRGRFDRWQAGRPFVGRWYPIAPPAPPRDALDREELVKDRVRLLLGRYGVVFRELLARELAPLAWRGIFRTLRLLELSGEVLAGHFFAGVPGPQFASREAFRRLRRGLPEDPVWWLNATDPASPAGLGLPELKGKLPPRVPGTHLVFHGTRLVAVSKRSGRELSLRVPPDHPLLPDYLGVFKVLLTREFDPAKKVDLERINGQPAPKSPYAAAIAEAFGATRDYKSVRLLRRY